MNVSLEATTLGGAALDGSRSGQPLLIANTQDKAQMPGSLSALGRPSRSLQRIEPSAVLERIPDAATATLRSRVF